MLHLIIRLSIIESFGITAYERTPEQILTYHMNNGVILDKKSFLGDIKMDNKEIFVFYSLLLILFVFLLLNYAIMKLDKEYAEKNKINVKISFGIFVLGIVVLFCVLMSYSSLLMSLFLILVYYEILLLLYDLTIVFLLVRSSKNSEGSSKKILNKLSLNGFFNNFKNDKNIRYPFHKRLLIIILPLISLNYMIFVFGVLELFFNNVNDWQFVFKDIISPSLIVFFILSSISALVFALLLKSDNIKMAAVFISALTLMSYLQNLLMNKSLIIDGRSYYSNAWDIKVTMNFTLWFLIGLGVVFAWILLKKKRPFILKASIWISGVLLIMQLAPLATLFSKAPESAYDRSSGNKQVLNGISQFEVSEKENVIVFIMDTFSRSNMEEFLNEHDEYREKLADCVWFDNVNTEAFYTALSMPSILTATPQDYTLNLQEANKKCWNSKNAEFFYDTLHKNGYKVNFYTDSDLYSGDANNMIGKIDNIMDAPNMVTEKFNTYKKMLSLSMFKYVPEILKQDFFVSSAYEINRYTHYDLVDYNYDLSQWTDVSNSSKNRGICYLNKDIVEAIDSGLTTNKTDKLCTFMHINGMHEPFDYNYTKLQAIQQCVDIYLSYINWMKEIDVYDNSTIILTADHGNHTFYDSQPVMIIKPKNYTNETLQVNSCPGNLQSDLLPTILYCQGIDTGILGPSLFDIDPNQKRLRVCRNFANKSEYPASKRINAYGAGQFNCYDEYYYYGDIKDVDLDDEHKTYTIKDYWA